MKFFFAFIAALLLAGCEKPFTQNDAESTEQTAPKPAPNLIRNYYYEAAAKLKLPLTWKNTSNELPVDEAKRIWLEEEDLKVFTGDDQPRNLIGVLADTSRFFTFLFGYPADDVRPYFVTFDKNGKKIDHFMTGYSCGADCGFYCIEGTFTLNKDYSFISRHVSYQAPCDDHMMEMDTSFVTYFVVERKGKILPNGKFSEGDDKTVEERTLPFSSPENPLRQVE